MTLLLKYQTRDTVHGQLQQVPACHRKEFSDSNHQQENKISTYYSIIVGNNKPVEVTGYGKG